MNKNIIKALGIILVIVPATIFGATILWNSILVEVVTWANPITFWQMLGLLVLFYIMYPVTKSNIKANLNDK